MSDARLPAHIEVSGLIRAVEAAGGFATVISSGEKDAGIVMILTIESGRNARLWERMPQLDGSRRFTCTREEDPENRGEFSDYLTRRTRQDPDSWLVELDVANAERFVVTMVT